MAPRIAVVCQRSSVMSEHHNIKKLQGKHGNGQQGTTAQQEQAKDACQQSTEDGHHNFANTMFMNL